MGEIKGVATGGAVSEFRADVGLLQKGQKAMLGLVVNMIQISRQILVVDREQIFQYALPPLQLDDDNLGYSLTQVAEMIVYINSF